MNVVHWGAGKLGLSLGVWDARCGHDVTFVDTDPKTVQAINTGRSPINEPQVEDLVYFQRGGFVHATHDGAGCVENADIIFIVVPTPSLEDGAFDLSYVEESCRTIGKVLRQKRVYTLVVCVSTIMPGDSRKLIKALEEESGQACGPHWGFAYSPEFVRQGSIVQDYANPDVLLIGASDTRAAHGLQEFYETVVQNTPRVYHMSLESAEIAKIGLNATVVAKIAMANQLAWLCHHTPGANATLVLASIGADPRIGHKYFRPGLWPGGPCFPRDCRALERAIDNSGGDSLLPWAIDVFTQVQVGMLGTEILREACQEQACIGLLGLTYKPGVSILEESPALRLADWLNAESPHRVIAYDPDVAVGISVPSLQDLVNQSAVIVVMTPKPQFRFLEGLDLSGKALFDCWNCIGETNADKHIVLGVGK